MANKHSAGPWHYEACFGKHKDEPPESLHFCFYDIRNAVDTIASTGACLRQDIQEADARLIASAPEMLEALREVQCTCSTAERLSGHKVECWMPRVMAAIRKAEGG